MSDERIILFDLGKVLIDFDHRIAVKKIMPYCNLDEKVIYDLFFDSGITDKYERGLISSFEFYQEAKKILGAEISYEEFTPIWNEIFTPNPEMLEFLGSLKDNYSLYMVSNINELHFQYLQKEFSQYFKYFTHIFLSYEMGLRKPDTRIYEAIIEYIKLPAQNIIYTDDRPELIESAKKLGMNAFVFTSTKGLKEELLRRNIKYELALGRR